MQRRGGASSRGGGGRGGQGRRGRGGRGGVGRHDGGGRGGCRGRAPTERCVIGNAEGYAFRRKFDALTTGKDRHIRESGEAASFLRCVCLETDKQGMVSALARADGAGALRVRESLQMLVDDMDTAQEHVMPLLRFLSSPQLAEGLYGELANDILVDGVYDSHVLRVLHRALNGTHGGYAAGAPTISAEDERLWCWFLARVCSVSSEARNSERVKRIAQLFRFTEEDSSAQHLRSVLTEGRPQHYDPRRAMPATPGGRHDNDKENFRDIRIRPTLDELQCQEDAYLPRRPRLHSGTGSASGLAGNDGDGGGDCSNDSELLGRQFRLLRESFLGPAREALASLSVPRAESLVPSLQHPRRNDALIFHGVRLEGWQAGYDSDNIDGRFVWCPEVTVSFDFSGTADHWEYLSQKRFGEDSLVCLVQDQTPLVILNVTRAYASLQPDRSQNNRAQRRTRAHIGVLSEDVDDLARLLDGSVFGAQPVSILLLSSNYFAVKHVLRRLQQISEIPFEPEIVQERKPLPGVGRRRATALLQASPGSRPLDATQRDAVERCLQERVGLVVGPPGTGKTYVGVEYVRAILAHPKQLTVLLVCVTNHALDSFLEDILEAKVAQEDNVLRIGGGSKHPRLQALGVNSVRGPRNVNERKFVAELYEARENARAELRCEDHRRALRVQVSHHAKQHVGWNIIAPFLQENFPASYRQLQVTDSSNDGWELVNQRPERFWEAWNRGQDPPAGCRGGCLWQLSHQDRLREQNKWAKELREHAARCCAEALLCIQQLCRRHRKLDDANRIPMLQHKRIIAATTSGAAKHASLLQELRPDVLVIEEAGEVLEAHVLASMSPSTKQLVMIGDHQQLCPKMESYRLREESGEGFDLDMSLFKRLVLAANARGRPPPQLVMQHRMHPEIAEVVRQQTYPLLEDHPRTEQRAGLRGCGDTAPHMVWFDHREQEVRGDGMSAASTTFSNPYEARMCAQVLRHLAAQGYTASQVVVLTPYVAQLRAIRSALQEEHDLLWEAQLDEQDADVLGEVAPALQQQQAVRLAVLDNFQGEESDIVVMSLVRSGGATIGFLKSPERVNVLMSRAKCCQIVIGNAFQFMSAPDRAGLMWRDIVGQFFQPAQMQEVRLRPFPTSGLVVRCVQHRDARARRIQCPEDFRMVCPDGGCTQPCEYRFPVCGHPCTRHCHPRDDHAQRGCSVRVAQPKCENGHLPPSRLCKEPPSTRCEECARESKRQAKAEAADAVREQPEKQMPRPQLQKKKTKKKKKEKEKEKTVSTLKWSEHETHAVSVASEPPPPADVHGGGSFGDIDQTLEAERFVGEPVWVHFGAGQAGADSGEDLDITAVAGSVYPWFPAVKVCQTLAGITVRFLDGFEATVARSKVRPRSRTRLPACGPSGPRAEQSVWENA